MKWLFALLCLSAPCFADLRTITVDAEFRQGNAGYFGLSLPIPATLFVQYDDAAVNTGTETLGIYETEGAYGGLSFGTGIGFHWIPFANTEVRVLAGYNGLRGIGFGNEDSLSAYGLWVPPYFCYAFFAVPQTWTPYPSDNALHWVNDLQSASILTFNAYDFVSGYTGSGVQVTLQTQGAISYSVQ